MAFIDITDKRYNAFAQVEKDPAIAAVKALKAKLAISLTQAIRNTDLTHAAVARRLKIKVSTYKKIIAGDLSEITLEDLVTFTVRFGNSIKTDFKKKKTGSSDTHMLVDLSIKITNNTAKAQ